jgi:hypothetical protein
LEIKMAIGYNSAFEKSLGMPRSQIVRQTAYNIALLGADQIHVDLDVESFAKQSIQIYESSVASVSQLYKPAMVYTTIFLDEYSQLAGFTARLMSLRDMAC